MTSAAFQTYEIKDGHMAVKMDVRHGSHSTSEWWSKEKVKFCATNQKFSEETRRRYVRILMDWPLVVQEIDDDALCAARWRALMNNQRLRVIGSNGFQTQSGASKFGYYHFGMEFWNIHPADDGHNGKAWLANYADLITTMKV